MPVKLSVSQVRQEIFRAAEKLDSKDEVQPSTRLLGKIFHSAFAQLFGDDERLHWRAALTNANPKKQEWRTLLEQHLYLQLIGPKLGHAQVHLRHSTTQVLIFWQASKALCQWLVNVLWLARGATPSGEFPVVNAFFSPEEPLSLEFRERDWTDSVLLTGIADLVLRIPDKPYWCIIELKLGRGCKEADLAQACLYHEIFSKQPDIHGVEGEGNSGALALVSFSPNKKEYVFKPPALKKSKQSLMNLIGRLAGVVPGETGPMSTPSPPQPILTPEEGIEQYVEQSKQLRAIFREYGKEITLSGEPVPGPTFIRYRITLGRGVKLNAAQGVAREVQHRLHLDTPPFIHISDGSVVIDIQRQDRQTVLFADIQAQLPAFDRDLGCAYVLSGVDLNNTLHFADLADPINVHILVAGTTGSGKSEWLRSALAGLILTNTPDTLRLVLIDPKRTAFNELKGSPFLMDQNALVYPDEQYAAEVLARLADEMDLRYTRLQQAGVDTQDQFIIMTGEKMPRIICVCDEYFDLISRGKQEREDVETQIFRLGAKARAVGIHLIIATQHPGRRVIKGALDANLPARVGLKMNKDIESKMLLDQKGAENLLGKGDLLFKDIGDPVRLQAPYLPSEERQHIFRA